MRLTRKQIFDASQKLKSANSYAALWVKCTFFNALASLKFAIVSLYLVGANLWKEKNFGKIFIKKVNN